MYEFEYSSPEEIRNILNKFLKSNFSTDRLTQFIKEVCLEYSELLFYSNKSLGELRDLETLKNALNERFRKYQRLCSSLENEISLLKKPSETKVECLNGINYESQYLKASFEINNLRGLLETHQKRADTFKLKEENLNSEFVSYKSIYTKELLMTKYDLEEVTQQRNALREQLIEFKTFFNNLTNK